MSPFQGCILPQLNTYVLGQAEIQAAQPAPMHLGRMETPDVEAPSQPA